MRETMDKNKKTYEALSVLAFAVLVAVIIVAGVIALGIPVVPMCLMIVIQAVLAVTLHHAELWVHGLLVLAEICAGVAAGKVVPMILCVVVYVAAMFALQMLDKGETQDGQ